MNGTEELERMAFDAMDAERGVYISYYLESEFIDYVEIDGVEFENHLLRDEIRDASDGWMAEAGSRWQE